MKIKCENQDENKECDLTYIYLSEFGLFAQKNINKRLINKNKTRIRIRINMKILNLFFVLTKVDKMI